MNKFIRWLERAERTFITTMLASSVVMSVIGVFYRYVLGRSLAFVEEIAGFILAGVIVIGSSLAVSRREHIRVELIIQLFPFLRRWINSLAWLVMLAVSVFMVVLTGRFVSKLLATQQTSTSVEWLYVGWPLMILPIGYAVCALKSIWILFEEVTGRAPAPAAVITDAGAALPHEAAL
jgi:TRAP-type C4-dicarboxylate transport system permease small subunit